MLEFPKTAHGDARDIYHGFEIPDPFRWLEDLDSQSTGDWIRRQNAFTNRYLDGLPGRAAIDALLADLRQFVRMSVPLRRGPWYFQEIQQPHENQAVLTHRRSLDAAPQTLFDPNHLSDDGTIAVTNWAPSPHGTYLAVAISEAGSDWKTIRVREVATGRDLADVIQFVKFSTITWSPDESGIFYARFGDRSDALAELNMGQSLQYHRLGTPQDDDHLILENPAEPRWGYRVETSDCDRYLIIHVVIGSSEENLVYVADLAAPGALSGKAPFQRLIDTMDAEYAFAGNDGPRFFFRTTLDAPRGRIIEIDLRHPDPERWRTIVPESRHVLKQAAHAQGKLAVFSLSDVSAALRVFDHHGVLEREVALPEHGAINSVASRLDEQHVYFDFHTFVRPPALYRLDLRTATVESLHAPETDADLVGLVTRQLFYASGDGTRVPMFVTHAAEVDATQPRPTLLYGYGGFNIAVTPFFSIQHAAWLKLGGILAVPGLRGGSEYGEEWHAAGKLENKQRVFDDFLSAARYLIDGGTTTSDRLAIAGGSNGGLLVGAAMTQEPALFRAAVPSVGVLDLLRYQLFTIGWAWASEYGVADDPAQFETLIAYSPLHNLRPGTAYPATLITTADHDDRVVPSHSFKFAAALQEAQAGDRPALIRIDSRSGHGMGKPTHKILSEASDVLVFLCHQLGIQPDAVLAGRPVARGS